MGRKFPKHKKYAWVMEREGIPLPPGLSISYPLELSCSIPQV
jgi:hypothetical protein